MKIGPSDVPPVVQPDPALTAVLSRLGWEVVRDGDYPDVPTRGYSGLQLLRKKVWNVVEGQLNLPAFLYQSFLLSVVTLSVLSYIIETQPVYYNANIIAFFMIRAVTSCLFAADWFLRLISLQRSFRDWITNFFTILDFATFLPFFILVGQGSDNPGISILIAFRSLRVVSMLSNYSTMFGAVVLTCKKSKEAFMLLILLIGCVLVTMSTLMYWAERRTSTYDDSTQLWSREDGSLSPFQSIGQTFYWTITTITTVGYGDTFPVSILGKFVAAVTQVIGILTLSFPITILGANFSQALQELRDNEKSEDEEMAVVKDDVESQWNTLQQEQASALAALVSINNRIASFVKTSRGGRGAIE